MRTLYQSIIVFVHVCVLSSACTLHHDTLLHAKSTNVATFESDGLARTSVALVRRSSSSGAYYLVAGVEEHKTELFMVDTGAGYSAFTSHIAALLISQNRVEQVGTVVMFTADGTIHNTSLMRLDELVLENSCILRNIEFVVMPNAPFNILGMQALTQFQEFTFHLDPPRLSMKACAR